MQFWKLKIVIFSLGISLSCSSDDPAVSNNETPKETDTSFKGTINWKKTFGGSLNEEAKALVVAPNGDYMLLGNSGSTDGTIGTNTSGTQDYWLMRINPTGEVIWSKTYGEFFNEYGLYVKEATKGEILIKAKRQFCKGENIGYDCYDKTWFFKTDSNGNMLEEDYFDIRKMERF